VTVVKNNPVPFFVLQAQYVSGNNRIIVFFRAVGTQCVFSPAHYVLIAVEIIFYQHFAPNDMSSG
jgi:hypothetical protein